MLQIRLSCTPPSARVRVVGSRRWQCSVRGDVSPAVRNELQVTQFATLVRDATRKATAPLLMSSLPRQVLADSAMPGRQGAVNTRSTKTKLPVVAYSD